MKIRKIFIFTALLLAILFVSACDNWDGSGNQGSIVINFDNSNGRYAVADDDIAKMIYTITLTSGNNTITRTTNKGDRFISIPVTEGIWNINVEAKGDGRIGKGKGKGKADVAVTAGKSASVPIEMTITGTRVSTWAELKEDIEELKKTGSKLKDLEEIEIIADVLEVSATATSDALTIITEKTITMWAKESVTIKRKQTSVEVNATVFTVNKGTFIMEGRNGGTITIDGNKDNIKSCIRALINVEANGTLKVNDGVILTNNRTQYGGAVHVSGANAYFYMYGGTITKNEASSAGGGVCVRDNGHFEKTGGIILGKNASNDSNTSPHGNAVCYAHSNDTYSYVEDNTIDGEYKIISGGI